MVDYNCIVLYLTYVCNPPIMNRLSLFKIRLILFLNILSLINFMHNSIPRYPNKSFLKTGTSPQYCCLFPKHLPYHGLKSSLQQGLKIYFLKRKYISYITFLVCSTSDLWLVFLFKHENENLKDFVRLLFIHSFMSGFES